MAFLLLHNYTDFIFYLNGAPEMQWTNKHKIFFAITVVIVILALSLFN